MSHKELNILHLTFDMGIGGTEQVIKNLIEGSAGKGINHHICCLEGPVGPWGVELEQKGIPVFKLQRAPKITWSVVKQLRDIIKNHDIDIVHGHQYTPFIFGFLATRFTHSSIIFTEHGRFYPDIVSKKRQLINRLIFPFVDGVTSISKATKQALVEHEKIPAKKIEVIYNGIEAVKPSSEERLTELRAELGIPTDAMIFGTIARLDPIKNQKMMIDGFAQAYKQNNNIRLVIVGDGPERSNLEKQIENLQLNGIVILTGFIPKPVDYINLLDVFLLTSLSEGTSMTLLEAMSAGKPSIVTNVGGNPEIVNYSFLGEVINNSNQFSCALNSYITSDSSIIKTKISNHFDHNYGVFEFSRKFFGFYNSQIRELP